MGLHSGLNYGIRWGIDRIAQKFNLLYKVGHR